VINPIEIKMQYGINWRENKIKVSGLAGIFQSGVKNITRKKRGLFKNKFG
jgi:hypothetical protein